MNCNWIELPLGDLIELKRGYDLPKSKRCHGNIPIVSSAGISDFHADSKVQAPGVVTGRYGTIGEVFYVEENFWPLNTTLYVKDFKGNCPEFVYYLLKTFDFHKYSDKAAVPGVNRNHLHMEMVRVPSDYDCQKKIANYLSKLDKKISLNTDVNNTLEEIAQAIFKSWFIDFDPVKAKMNGEQPEGMDAATASLFPEKLVESELGLIPEGWEVESLAELMDIKGGTQPPSKHFADELREGYVRLVQIRDYDTDNHLTYIPDEKKLRRTSPLDVMIGRYGAAVGRILWGLSGAYNVALVKAEPKRENVREFLRTYLLSNKFQAPMQMMSGRSAQSGFNKSDIASYKLALPSPEIFEAYENLALPIRRYGLSLKQQTRDLEVLRDTLLPKLLSGEIELGQAQELAEVE
ncbi:restriction endonuclease subunit S [Vibrio alginolyticus]|nr:restriction endonuclease subunit S [Vibrio alginolyticus]